jgi:O-antigen/teichoic acid export membrane protein
MIAADLASRVLGIVAFAAVARAMGPANFGILNLALGVLAFATVASDPGLQYVAQRSFVASTSDRDGLVTRMVGLRGALAVMTVLVAALSFALHSSVLLWLVFLYVISLLPQSLSLAWLYTANERMGTRAVGQLLGSVLYTSWVVLLVRDSSDLSLVPLGLVVANLASAAYLFVRAPSAWKQAALAPSTRLAGSTLREALPFGASLLLAQSLIWLDSFLLAALTNSEAVGVYHAAYRWVLLVLGLGVYFPQALFPVLVRLSGSRQGDRLIEEATRVIGIVGVFAAIALCGSSSVLVGTIFGPAYEPAVSLLVIIAWVVPLAMHNSLAVHYINARGRETRALVITAMVVVVNLSLNLILIPLAGPAGAAIALLVAETLSAALCLVELGSLGVGLRSTYASLAAAAVAAVAAFLSFATRPAWAALAAAFAFSAVLAVTGELGLSRFRSYREIFWNRRAYGDVGLAEAELPAG